MVRNSAGARLRKQSRTRFKVALIKSLKEMFAWD